MTKRTGVIAFWMCCALAGYLAGHLIGLAMTR